MFCKFCGKEIPDQSAFCPECGKKLKKEEPKKKESSRSPSTPLILMLIVLCWSTVFAWGQVLLFGVQLHIGTLISTVMLVAGLALLGALIGRGRIPGEVYRFSDLLVLCCVWMVVPSLTGRWESYIVHHLYGQYAHLARVILESGVMQAIQFPAFWIVLGLIALGLARSGGWNPAKKHRLILSAVLLACSVMGVLFGRIFAAGMGAPMEVIDMVVHGARVWALFCWLWPLVILKVFRALGEDRIGTGGAIACLLGMQLGKAFLLPVFMAVLDFGIAGFALAKGLSPLFGLLILNIAAKAHRKK